MTKASGSARERLLAAADRLFYAEGIHTVGIDRLISEAGVAKGSLFYNFAGKGELVAAYLSGRQQDRRERIARHQESLVDPVERILVIFDVLEESALSPTYNGCPFANAYVEAAPNSVEAKAVKTFRTWLAGTFLALTREASFANPEDVARRLGVLYDGAISTAHLDAHPDAVRLAREMAVTVMASERRAGALAAHTTPEPSR